MDERRSRRSLLASAGALALTGLAGCTSSGPEDATPADDTAGQTDTPAESTTDREPDTSDGESTPSVDWSDVAGFRTWITDYTWVDGGNSRFDYQQVGVEQLTESGRASFLDLDPERVDGVLFHAGTVCYLGNFDAGALSETVESSDAHDVTGSYGGYTTADATETGARFAIGDDAVLAGASVEQLVDAHRGERERLEESAPVFTRLFDRLPDRGLVTGQFGAPVGGEVDADAIDAWAHSMPSLDAADGTWVYALASGTSTDEVDELEVELAASAFTEDVLERTVDGRFVTFTASMAKP